MMLLIQSKSFKRENHCTTNYSVYFIKYSENLDVCLSITTESSLITASIQTPFSAMAILPRNKVLFLPNHALFNQVRLLKQTCGGSTGDKPTTEVSQAQNSFLSGALISL